MLKKFLLASFLFLAATSNAMADTISVRADEWCPYNCAPSDKKIGFGIEIAKAIFEKAGHGVDYKVLNWTRSIEETRAGNYSSILGATKTEVPDFIYPKEAIGYYQTAYISTKEKPFEYNGPSSLEDKLLGAIQSYNYDPEIDAYIAANKNNHNRIEFATGDDALTKNINKLLVGRLDVVLDGTYVLLYKIDSMGLTDKIHISLPAKTDYVYLAFSPKNPKSQEYADLFDKGIAELRASGELKTILAKYGLKDWK